ncbi:MAG: glycosyltransferase family 2 protein [Chloroflexi bacterium]|nr:MAG: glycosyltransferase family 2 protein [Chloroflexota bacterium]
MDPMRLGIVIVSYHVRELLRGCLESVYADLNRSPGLQATVVVVDNASTDGSAEMVASEFPWVTLHASRENLGFARGNNLALRSLGFDSAAHTHPPDAVLLLNPDTEVQPGALAVMSDFLAGNPHAGGCGARLNYGDGSFQHSAFRFPGLMQLFLDLFPLHPRLLETRLNGRYPRRLYEGREPFAVDFVLGAALMVRAQAIQQVGLLDEGYFMYAEEMDWCHRLHDAGWPLYLVPTARITHYEGRSARQFRSAMTVALWRSRLRYYNKYYPRWKRQAARELLHWGMRVKIMRARKHHRRGLLSGPALEEEVRAYRQVLALL